MNKQQELREAMKPVLSKFMDGNPYFVNDTWEEAIDKILETVANAMPIRTIARNDYYDKGFDDALDEVAEILGGKK